MTQQRQWFFEIYIKGPAGETGWEIKVGYVITADKARKQIARDKIKAHFGLLFDEVIELYDQGLYSPYRGVTDLGCPYTLIG